MFFVMSRWQRATVRGIAMALICLLSATALAQNNITWINPADRGVQQLRASSQARVLVSLGSPGFNCKRWNYESGGYAGTTAIPDPDNGADIDVSPDGRLVAVTEVRGGVPRVGLYSAEGTLVKTFTDGYWHAFKCARFSPDGRFLLIGFQASGQGRVYLQPLASGVSPGSFQLPNVGVPSWIEITPDSKTMVIGCYSGVVVWQLGKTVPSGIIGIGESRGALSSDGHTLALSSNYTNGIGIFDIRGAYQTATIQTPGDVTTALAFDAGTGNLYATLATETYGKCAIQSWTPSHWQSTFRTIVLEGRLNSIVSPKGDQIFVAGDNFGLWSLDKLTGSLRRQIERIEFDPQPTFSPNGSAIFAANALLDSATGLTRWRTQAGILSGGGISPDGTRIALIAQSHVVVERETDGAVLTSIPTAQQPYSVGFSRDGRLLAILESGQATWLQRLAVFDTATWQPIADIQAPSWVYDSPKFLPDGSRLLVAAGEYVYAYDTATWSVVGSTHLPNPSGTFLFALSPDGSLIAATYNSYPEMDLKFVRTDTMQVVATWPIEPQWLRFSPDGSVLWTLHNLQLHADRLSDGTSLFVSNNPEMIDPLTFDISPDNANIVCGRYDGTVLMFPNPLR